MNPPCQKMQSLREDYRWLNAIEREPLDRHLAICADCRESYRQAQAVGQWFSTTRAPAPPGLADAVMTAVERQPQSTRAGWLAVGVLLAMGAVEIAVAIRLRASPVGLWDKAATVGGAFWSHWCAPTVAAWRDMLASAFGAWNVSQFWPSSASALWVGAALVALLVWVLWPRREAKHV